MTRLPRPLKDVLDTEPDEPTLQRMWRAIDAPPRAGASLRTARVAIAGAVVVAGAAASWAWWSRGPGALTIADGRPLQVLEVGSAEGSQETELSDGSQVTLDPETRLEALENDGATLALHLRKGAAELRVEPGERRRWIIECGLVTVELLAAEVSTGLSIERSPTRVRIGVISGRVLVRGERVPDRVRQLVDGEVMEVAVEELAPEPDVEVPVSSVAPAVTSAGAGPAPPVVPAPKRSAVSAPTPTVAPQVSAAPVAAETPVAATPTIDDLMLLADEARRRGDPDAAAAILERAIAAGPPDTLAALASFTLGRIALLQLGDPQRARAAFERALGWPLPLELSDDARAYLAESCARSGDREAARAAALTYLREHPAGPQAAAMRALAKSSR